jgi:hypothetical protein
MDGESLKIHDSLHNFRHDWHGAVLEVLHLTESKSGAQSGRRDFLQQLDYLRRILANEGFASGCHILIPSAELVKSSDDLGRGLITAELALGNGNDLPANIALRWKTSR